MFDESLDSISFFGNSNDSDDYYDFLGESQEFLDREGIDFGTPYDFVFNGDSELLRGDSQSFEDVVFDDTEELFEIFIDRFGHCSFELYMTDNQVELRVSYIDSPSSGSIYNLEKCMSY